jgi:electron transfer flavoprotein beta subunit
VRILVCVKRVPITGGRIVLTEDARGIETRFLGFTVSPHEECAVEEAVRLVESHGGETVVLTLGPPEAQEQLRDAMAIGADRGVLLETDGSEWDPQATARAIVEAVGELEEPFDLLLFGNEAADSGDYQVPVRVAHALGLPCVTGVKSLEVHDGGVTTRREAAGGWEVFELPMPAVVAVREGINLPRFPSVPGRLRAKKKPVETVAVKPEAGGQELVVLKLPAASGKQAEILGQGPEAAPRVVEILRSLGLVS